MKRLAFLVPMLLLSHVAFGQAAMPRPPPPPALPQPPSFRPELDAPHTIGQPGQSGAPALPPSPNKRIVIPRKDGQPQVVAADGAQASHRPRGMPLSEYRTKRDIRDVPMPGGMTESEWKDCWSDTQEAMNANANTALLGDDEYECLRNKLLDVCGERAILRRYATRPMDALDDLGRLTRTQSRLTMMICGGANMEEVNRLLPRIAKSVESKWTVPNKTAKKPTSFN